MRTSATLIGGTIVLGLAAVWILRDLSARPGEAPDRGPAGIEFLAPDGYRVVELGESTTGFAARRLLLEMGGHDRVAVVFTRSGDRIHLLVDVRSAEIIERAAGRQGTVKQTSWSGSIEDRLRWATEHGDLAAPGLPPPSTRNAYH